MLTYRIGYNVDDGLRFTGTGRTVNNHITFFVNHIGFCANTDESSYCVKHIDKQECKYYNKHIECEYFIPFKFAEDTFGDETYYEKNHKKGRVNPEFTITYTIKSASLAAPTVDPANGAEVENLNTITLTFAEAVTANAEAGAISMVNNSNQN